MTAKEYLQQYELCELEIQHLCEERAELRHRLYSISAVDTEKERVQGGRWGNNKVEKFNAIEEEIDELIDAKYRLKKEIIDKIHQLNKPEYVDLLYKRYIEINKPLKKIAKQMNRSYDNVRHLHGEALAAMEKIIKVDTQKHI